MLTDQAQPGEPAGTLYLVPTPIGNPRDLSQRAIDVLGQVGVIAAEDTRHARSLLQPLGIGTRLLSYHDHNEESRTPQLLDLLAGGTDVALVSDAGTPMVNDPGYRVVLAAIAGGFRVCPLPGPSAALTGLIGSGLPVHSFHYAGFLPRRSAARQASLRRLAELAATLIFFEAPHRLAEMLEDLQAVLGDRPAALARNLTKRGEQFQRGTLSELIARLAEQDTVRGEYTVIVSGNDQQLGDEAQAQADRIIQVLLDNGASGRLVRDAVRELTGLPRNWVYERVQANEATRGQAQPRL
ncbi:MAG: 16S rRNA (cytidine(1402)-2'-O)-methyltransferase [Jatrophihabitantaceae bacterium]